MISCMAGREGAVKRDCAKACYADKKAARSAMHLRLSARCRHKRPEGLKIYACGHCGGWHLAKREEMDFKPTRAQAGERKARKHSRRDHAPVRTWEGTGNE